MATDINSETSSTTAINQKLIKATQFNEHVHKIRINQILSQLGVKAENIMSDITINSGKSTVQKTIGEKILATDFNTHQHTIDVDEILSHLSVKENKTYAGEGWGTASQVGTVTTAQNHGQTVCSGTGGEAGGRIYITGGTYDYNGACVYVNGKLVATWAVADRGGTYPGLNTTVTVPANASWSVLCYDRHDGEAGSNNGVVYYQPKVIYYNTSYELVIK